MWNKIKFLVQNRINNIKLVLLRLKFIHQNFTFLRMQMWNRSKKYSKNNLKSNNSPTSPFNPFLTSTTEDFTHPGDVLGLEQLRHDLQEERQWLWLLGSSLIPHADPRSHLTAVASSILYCLPLCQQTTPDLRLIVALPAHHTQLNILQNSLNTKEEVWETETKMSSRNACQRQK